MRSPLLSLGSGVVVGAAFTRPFQTVTTLRLGALYAALLGLSAHVLITVIALQFAAFVELASVLATFPLLLGALTGLAVWTLLRFRRLEAAPPGLKMRGVTAALFASGALLVGLSYGFRLIR